jgi:hypothetical protein
MLVCAVGIVPVPVSPRLPPRGYDEPERLSYAISSICPVSADGERRPQFVERSFQIRTFDETLLFCDEYTRHMKKLLIDATSSRTAH